MSTAEAIEHISEKPWSEYKEADYTLEQWHSACLIHLHDGPPTSKSQCKLPVKTPNGALNRNGVHAAAAAMAGARSPLQAPSEQKAKAARTLRGYYSQLGEKAPPSLMKHSAFELIEDALTHVGIKGMKWGVRKSPEAKAAQKVAKADKKWEKKTVTFNTYVRVHNKAAERANKEDVDRINNKPQYKAAAERGDFKDGSKPITQKYTKEHQDAFLAQVRKAAAEEGMNPSGTKKVDVITDANGDWYLTLGDVKHDALTDGIKVHVVYDDLGQIVRIESIDSMEQSSMFVDNVLAHFGVKGMKWGVRRKATVGPQEVIISDRRVGTGVKTRGGAGHPIHRDAARARTVGQIGKKSGLKALSDKELQDYAKRLQMEQNVKRLNYAESNPARKFVLGLLGQTGKGVATDVTKEVASQQVRKRLVKAGVLAAKAAAA